MAVARLDFQLFGVVKREGSWFVAHCPPLDVTTQGRSQAQAKKNLEEAAELFLTSCIERGTLDQALRELGFLHVEGKASKPPAKSFELSIPISLKFHKNAPCHA